MRFSLTACLVCAGFLAGLTNAPAQVAPAPTAPAPAPEPGAPAPEGAPTAKPKPKPRPKPQGPRPAQALTVVNASANTALDVIITGEGQTARLGKPLAPKARATLRLPKLKQCTVSVQAMFQGGGFVEMNDFDVCKETSIRFTE